MKFLKVATIILSIFYPFALLYLPDFKVILFLAMAVLWFARGYFEPSAKAVKIGVGVFFMLCLVAGQSLAFLYPIIINLALCAFFALSLRSVPAITRLAMLREPDLDKNGKAYTRTLTKIWVCFFIVNALISALLLIPDDKMAWAYYCGVLSYILIFALLGGEMIFRKFYVKKLTSEA